MNDRPLSIAPLTRWAIARCQAEDLDRMLDAEWEPFAVTVMPSKRMNTFGEIETDYWEYIWLRRRQP